MLFGLVLVGDLRWAFIYSGLVVSFIACGVTGFVAFGFVGYSLVFVWYCCGVD